jgi:hypothetical protein
MADVGLDLVRSQDQVIIDGALADNRLFTHLLAALRPDQRVAVSPERAGPAVGAALLWGWAERKVPVPLDLIPSRAPRIPGLAGYARRWREAAEATAALTA